MSDVDPSQLWRDFTFLGPFAYAKGPAVFVSARLAGQISAVGSWSRHNLEAIVADRRGQNVRCAETWRRCPANAQPWEDVWMGLALATTARGDDLTSVHMGSVVYSEGAGGSAYPAHTSSLAWHNGHNLRANGSDGVASRLARVHESLSRQPCHTPSVELNCQGHRGGRKARPADGDEWVRSGALTGLWPACSGARWERCLVVTNYTACPKVRASVG